MKSKFKIGDTVKLNDKAEKKMQKNYGDSQYIISDMKSGSSGKILYFEGIDYDNDELDIICPYASMCDLVKPAQ